MKKFLTASVFTVILIFSVSCSVEDDLSLPDDEVGSAVDNETELPDAQIDDSNEFPDTNNNQPDNTPVPDESNLQPDDFDEQPDETVERQSGLTAKGALLLRELQSEGLTETCVSSSLTISVLRIFLFQNGSEGPESGQNSTALTKAKRPTE